MVESAYDRAADEAVAIAKNQLDAQLRNGSLTKESLTDIIRSLDTTPDPSKVALFYSGLVPDPTAPNGFDKAGNKADAVHFV